MNRYQKSNLEIERNFAEHRKYVSGILYGLIRAHGFIIDFHEQEDLIQIGLINLLESYRKYDESKEVPFESYAHLRVSGGFIDEFRKNSAIPRRQQNVYKEYNKLVNDSHKKGEKLTLCDAAKALKISEDKLSALLLRWEAKNKVYIDEETPYFVSDNIEFCDPEKVTLDYHDKKIILMALENASDRDKEILSMYFVDELNLKEIGSIMGLAEGRVSQLKNNAIKKIREQVLTKENL